MRFAAITVLIVALALAALALMGPGGVSAPDAPAATEVATAPAPVARTKRELRDELLRAANRLENSPCDQRLKPPLRAAILAFLEEARPGDDEIAGVIRGAVNAGVINLAEARGLAPGTGGTVTVTRQGGSTKIVYNNPFDCDLGGAKDVGTQRSRR
jgi:hypothetical protein